MRSSEAKAVRETKADESDRELGSGGDEFFLHGFDELMVFSADENREGRFAFLGKELHGERLATHEGKVVKATAEKASYFMWPPIVADLARML